MSAIPAIPSTAPTYDTSPAPDLPPLAGGDIGAEVAALNVEVGNSERTNAHDQREADEANQQTADNQQVQALHDEASSIRTQAWIDGAIGVAEACATVAIGVSAANAASTAGGAANAASGYNSATGASTAIFTGVNKVFDGLCGAGQKDDEANAAADKAAADRYAADAQDASQDATDADSFVNASLDFVRGYEATVAATQTAALHRA
jgi:hypothetical protein